MASNERRREAKAPRDAVKTRNRKYSLTSVSSLQSLSTSMEDTNVPIVDVVAHSTATPPYDALAEDKLNLENSIPRPRASGRRTFSSSLGILEAIPFLRQPSYCPIDPPLSETPMDLYCPIDSPLSVTPMESTVNS